MATGIKAKALFSSSMAVLERSTGSSAMSLRCSRRSTMAAIMLSIMKLSPNVLVPTPTSTLMYSSTPARMYTREIHVHIVVSIRS